MRQLVAKGMSWEDAAEMAEQFEVSLAEAVAAALPKRSASAERQAAYRARRNAEHNDEHNAVTDTVTDSVDNIPLSPALSPQTPQTHPHTREVSTTRGKRGSRRVFGEWLPSAKTLEALESEGFSSGDLERALTRMRDHEFKTPRTDWDATFRNWVRADADRKPSTRNVKPYADQRQAAREDSLRAHQSGAMAALNRRLG